MTDDEILALIRAALVDVAPDRGAEWQAVTLATDVPGLDLDSISVMEMVGVIE